MKWGKSGTPEEILKEWDAWTRQGRRAEILAGLAAALKSRPEPRYLPQLARLANRNHAYLLGLRILHRVIQEDREKIAPANPEALNVYSTSLLWIGALEEARSHLSRIPDHPEALLTQAFVHFASWEYERAIPALMKYIDVSELTVYQRLVGQVNLLAALIAIGRLDEGRAILSRLKPALREERAQVLFGNTLELESQIAIQEGRFDLASRTLEEAEEALSGQPGRSFLYVKKWKAVVTLALQPGSLPAREALLAVRKEAEQLHNWETIRDCDFHLARLTGQTDLLHRILLGTPYRGFRQRVKELYGLEVPKDRRLEYCPQDVARGPERIGLDLEAVRWDSFFPPTSWPLIQLMTHDIYRPPRVGVVFSALYPGEHFNPFTSPQRARNSVFRFNQWAASRDFPFRIFNRQGDYFLAGPAGQGVACASRSRPVEGWEAALRIFRRSNGPRSFTAVAVASELGICSRTARALLRKAAGRNRIERIGRGRSSRYIFRSGRRRKKAA